MYFLELVSIITMQTKKISTPTQGRDLENYSKEKWGGGGQKLRFGKKCIKLNWNF